MNNKFFFVIVRSKASIKRSMYLQVNRARMSSLLSVYNVTESDDGQPSSSSTAAAVSVYDATNVDQVTAAVDSISVQLLPSVSASPGNYAVLLQTGDCNSLSLPLTSVARLRSCCGGGAFASNRSQVRQQAATVGESLAPVPWSPSSIIWYGQWAVRLCGYESLKENNGSLSPG